LYVVFAVPRKSGRLTGVAGSLVEYVNYKVVFTFYFTLRNILSSLFNSLDIA
jgi:hypothetical protein